VLELLEGNRWLVRFLGVPALTVVPQALTQAALLALGVGVGWATSGIVSAAFAFAALVVTSVAWQAHENARFRGDCVPAWAELLRQVAEVAGVVLGLWLGGVGLFGVAAGQVACFGTACVALVLLALGAAAALHVVYGLAWLLATADEGGPN
jgi:hypothetical protein